jgi:flagellar hook assembly protein FlgD
VDLIIYNILGQKVRRLVNEKKEKGNYSVQWDGRNDKGEELSTGVYFYVLKVGDYTSTKRMILLK